MVTCRWIIVFKIVKDSKLYLNVGIEYNFLVFLYVYIKAISVKKLDFNIN